ncbi:hypothetical protein ANAEL_03855 [Anaerolineales bacterium]|nr:hypothetical protein ANAEL_03855 [Anaerolineales bacterium]
MKNKRTFIILGAIGLVVFVLFWVVVLTLAVKFVRGLSADKVEAPVVEMTLCDEDSSGLCVVNFGTNSLNRMVINFLLPDEEYAAFYVKAKNRDTVGVYTCEVDKSDSTAARCTGLRTPLGETIDLEVYTTDGDTLIARGTFLVAALAIPTPISQPTVGPATATEEPVVTEVPYMTEEPFPTGEPSIDGESTPPPEGESTPPPEGESTPPPESSSPP